MQPIRGLLLTLSVIGVAAPALGQPAGLSSSQRALLGDVFTTSPAKLHRQPERFIAAPLAVRQTVRSTLGAGGVFALPAVTGSSLDQTHLLNTQQLINGQGLAVWRTSEVSFPARGGAIDTLRMTVGGVARAPGGVVTAWPDSLMAPDAQAFDLSYTRGWPSAWSVQAGHYALDVSPHAGFGISGAGGSAEAGALVRLGRDLQDRVVERLGLTMTDTTASDGRGRWFLFAAASGRAVGVNVASSADGGLSRAGWSNDPSTSLVSDAQAGVGWRRGDLQASFGYVHRAVKNQAAIMTGAGPASYHDSMVAFSFTIRPR